MRWVPAGHEPSLDEALAKLDYLRAHGDSEMAFGWDWPKEARHSRRDVERPALAG